MEDLKNNKLVWLVVAFLFLNLTVFGLSTFIVERTTEQVIERLKQEYSPSPYGPSFDPDKVSPDHSRVNFDGQNHEVSSLGDISFYSHGGTGVLYFSPESIDWRNGWEKDRGFNQ